MKTLIAYYSFTKSNETLALYLQKRIDCDILKIEDARKRTVYTILFDLLFNRKPAIKTSTCLVGEYDHVILISPIWAAKIASPLATFIRSEKQNIKRYSFISFCGGGEGQKDKIVKQLTNILGKSPAHEAELWLKELPMPKEKRDDLKWNSGYIMEDDDFKFFDSRIDSFISMSGVPRRKDRGIMHEHSILNS
jgi:flavodoxin